MVLVNTTPGHTGRIEDAVARAALGLARNVVLDLPLASEENARYLGTYDLGDRASAFTLHQGDAVIHAPRVDGTL